jgi:hypothetical protein
MSGRPSSPSSASAPLAPASSVRRRGLLFFAMSAGMLSASLADYDGPTTPEIEAWFRSVKNGDGQVCCDGTEVARVDDYQWRGDHFDVLVDGVTYHAKGAQITREPNRLGDAIVWFYPRFSPRSDETLRCFMRGSEG